MSNPVNKPLPVKSFSIHTPLVLPPNSLHDHQNTPDPGPYSLFNLQDLADFQVDTGSSILFGHPLQPKSLPVVREFHSLSNFV
jgi:hypothetical protein